MHLYNSKTGKFVDYDKHYGRKLTAETFKSCFQVFFNNGHGIRRNAIRPMIHTITNLLHTVENLPGYRYFSTSLLMIYEGADQNSSYALVRMIDFAQSHFPPSPQQQQAGVAVHHVEGVDEGYTMGLRNLLAILNEMLGDEM